MSEILDKNLAVMLERGAEMRSSLSGRSLYIENLDLVTAVDVSHALTIQLDNRHGERAMYKPRAYTRETVDYMVNKAFDMRDSYEARPDDRNLAVRLERGRKESYTIVADVRNDYEDFPEKGGGMLLQLGFIAALSRQEL